MPPLERLRLESPDFLTVDDNRIVKGKVNDDVFSRAPLPQSHDYVVLSRRDVIIGTNPLYDFTLQEEMKDTPKQRVLDLMDLLTNLCVCRDTHNFHPKPKPRKAATAAKKNIMYPVARYPARLNSPEMVQQRRKSLQKHLTFRPVSMQ